MAGVRKQPYRGGKYQGWFVDMNGKQKFFTGTTNKRETLDIARRLEDEHRQIRLGYREAPKSSDQHKHRAFSEVAGEYLAWGASCGGRRGFPWSKVNAKRRESHLRFYQEKLGLETLGDVEDILPRVEVLLREMQAKGRTGKTLQDYVESIKAFCNWCVYRCYLDNNPVQRLANYDTTPRTTRRAMTEDEISRLLKVATDKRRLIYVMALTTGLRASELRSLKVQDINADFQALNLHPEWTKNRKGGRQEIPTWLVDALKESSEDKSPGDPLLNVPTHMDRSFNRDLEKAKISKHTPAGRLDFHSLRVAYTTLLFESGTDLKTAQTLARHSTASLTLDTYARTRPERVFRAVDQVGEKVLEAMKSGQKYAICMQQQAVGADTKDELPIVFSELHGENSPEGRRFKSVRPDHFSGS